MNVEERMKSLEQEVDLFKNSVKPMLLDVLKRYLYIEKTFDLTDINMPGFPADKNRRKPKASS